MVEQQVGRRYEGPSVHLAFPAEHTLKDRGYSRHRPVSRPVVGGMLRVADAFILVVTAAISHQAYLGHIFGPVSGWPSQHVTFALIALLLQLNLFHFAGLYKFDVLRRPYHQNLRMGVAWSMVFFLLITLGFLTKTSDQVSRGWMLIWFFSGLGSFAVVRAAISGRIGIWQRQGRFRRNVVIFGAGEQANRLIQYLENAKESDAEILGVFDDRGDRVPAVVEGHAKMGSTEDLIEFTRDNRVDEVLVALPWTAEGRLLDLFKKFSTLPVDVRLGPDLIGYRLPQCSFDQLGRVPILNVAHKPLSDWKFLSKAIEDRAMAALIMLFILPLFLAIAALVKISSPGPVLFRQKRFGFNNHLIDVYKFRTMYHDQGDADADCHTTKGDILITPLGRFLRRSSLDELPQFINVLKGEMSIVGPRPHAILTKAKGRLFEEVVQNYASRHRVKPGITGWAQINGWRGETDTEDKIRKRVEHDLYYIENWSIALDLKIMLITIFVLLKGNNAY